MNELTPQSSDEDLARGVAARLMEHRRALYSYIYACVRDPHLADDLMQDTAQAALESYGTLRDQDKFANWLFGIARKRILMHARKAKRERQLPPEVVELMATEASEMELEVYSERKQALSHCLGELPEHSREVILRRYDGSVDNVEQLAEEMGRSVQAAYGVLKRIRQKLIDCVRKKLSESHDG